jgi:repressor LexA
MSKELTSVQAKILAYLQRFANSGEPMPTLREICKAFGWASTATARDHLRALAIKGKITLAGRRSRQIRVIRGRSGVTHLPFIGSVVAGIPIEAEENIDGVIPVPSEWTTAGTHFVLRVVGDSMIGAGILSGDYVVIRSQEKAENGDIVVATIDGETTVKRLRRSRGVLTLIAENKKYRSIPVRSESSTVQGVVVGLLRSYAHNSVS